MDWQRADRLRPIVFLSGGLLLPLVLDVQVESVALALLWLVTAVATLWVLQSDTERGGRQATRVPTGPGAGEPLPMRGAELARMLGIAAVVAVALALLIGSPSCDKPTPPVRPPVADRSLNGGAASGSASGGLSGGASGGQLGGSSGSPPVSGPFTNDQGQTYDGPYVDGRGRPFTGDPSNGPYTNRNGQTYDGPYINRDGVPFSGPYIDGNGRPYTGQPGVGDPGPGSSGDGSGANGDTGTDGGTGADSAAEPNGDQSQGGSGRGAALNADGSPTGSGSSSPDLSGVLKVLLGALALAILVGLGLVAYRALTTDDDDDPDGDTVKRSIFGRRQARTERQWAIETLARLAKEGQRRGRPRRRSETVQRYADQLGAGVLDDDRLAGVGRVLSDAFYGYQSTTQEQRNWADAVVDEAIARPVPPVDCDPATHPTAGVAVGAEWR